ncbi:unnamed protein product, partial [marine sediment metagenome]
RPEFALLLSNTNLTADMLVRPRYDGTTPEGVALTDDPPHRFAQVGNVTFTVTGASATGIVYNALVKYEKR